MQTFVDKALRTEDTKKAEGKKEGFTTRCAKVDETVCKLCKSCTVMQSFYCDAIVNRTYSVKREEVLRNLGENAVLYVPPARLVPKIDPKLCRGCGLCVQLCTNKALRITYSEEECKEIPR